MFACRLELRAKITEDAMSKGKLLAPLLVNYVDPQIGGVAPFLQPTRTRIHLPNSMVRMYPVSKRY